MKKFFFLAGGISTILLGFFVSIFFKIYSGNLENTDPIFEWAILLGFFSGILLEIFLQVGENEENFEEGATFGGVTLGSFFQSSFFLLFFFKEETGEFLETLGIFLLLTLSVTVIFWGILTISIFLTRLILKGMKKVWKKI